MKKILVIEDDLNVRIGIKELLNNFGYNVFTAEDGKQGLKMAKEIIPDSIVCDVMMPLMDGFTLCKLLQEDDRISTVPLIFLTAKAEMSDLRKGMELGADDYIVKPFESKTLLNAIEIRLLKKDKLKKASVENILNQSNKEKRKLNENDRIFINNNSKAEFIKIGEVIAISAFGNYSQILTLEKKKEIVRKTLNQWQNQLPESNFLRIHRSTIINLNYISKISRWTSGTYRIHLKNIEDPLVLSQRYAHQIKNKLKF